jgi:serine protease Do
MRTLGTVVIVSLAAWLGTAAAFGQSSKTATFTSGSYLGVMVQEIDSERAKALKLPEEAGVEITRVESDSPADKAGLKTGDVILQYNGQRVEGMEQFSRLVRETPVGRDTKLNIVRDGAPQTVTAKVGARRALPGFVPLPSDRFEIRIPDIPRSFMSWRSPALGVEAESLDGQLAQFFGVKEGVLVRSVIKGGAAEKAGIRAGDVITRVGDTRVATPADISSALRSSKGKQVAVVVMRDHKETTVNVTLGDDDRVERGWEQFVTPGWHGRPIALPYL